MNVILSIKPRFVAEIVAGRKTYEYRKRIFKEKVERVYVYASNPVCRIIGEFSLGDVLIDQPSRIWLRTCDKSGITKDYFDKYYMDKGIAYALEIKKFQLYDDPINPNDLIEKFTPPQSYCYVRDNLFYQNKKRLCQD